MNPIAQPTTGAPTQLLDYQELSGWLNDSVRHLRRLVNERRIPYVKVGHFVRFDPEQIREWLEANGRAPVTAATTGHRPMVSRAADRNDGGSHDPNRQRRSSRR